MIEVKIEVKTKRYDDKVKKMLAETVEKMMRKSKGGLELHNCIKELKMYEKDLYPVVEKFLNIKDLSCRMRRK
ncbi:MAG: hypothetical protein KAT65_01120 [Methanophagales archaeon]|nr:hypothetical protein [Methanophagales archaeon]